VAVLDLRAARSGRRLYQLTAEQVRAPYGVEVLQVTPATVVLAFEHSLSRELPVAPVVEGEPAPGFIAGKVTVDPPLIEVVGPESAVQQATDAITEEVSIASASTDVIETVTVGLLDPRVRLKTPRQATVTVPIVPAPRERTVRDRPVRLRNLTAGLTAQALPPSVDVLIRGTREGISRVAPDALDAFVDLTGLGAGDYSLTVHVNPSPDAGIARVSPDTVQVRIASAKD
jgi:YbbR domain-containing protein